LPLFRNGELEPINDYEDAMRGFGEA
jgi:hypothetical protein